MKLAKLRCLKYTDGITMVPDRSQEELFELTKQMGNDVRVNPYSGESMSLSPVQLALHDCIWAFIIRFGDDATEVFQLKALFNGLNPDAYMTLLD